MIKFTIYGNPVPKGRPKFTVRGGYAMAYTSKKTRNAMQDMRMQSIPFKPDKPLEGAIILTVTIYRSIPKSFSKKKIEMAENGILRPITRPDVSNYLKGIEDAFNKIMWNDDSQIVRIIAGKYYSNRPRIEIEIQEVMENEKS